VSCTLPSSSCPSVLTPPAFLFGVMSLTFTCLLYGLAPEWLPFAYTAQSAFYLPLRVWTYKRKAWHYFLFGEMRDPCRQLLMLTCRVRNLPLLSLRIDQLTPSLCYFVNILDLLWIWVFPFSTSLFICAYLLTLGS
jgi:hypothetical protein